MDNQQHEQIYGIFFGLIFGEVFKRFGPYALIGLLNNYIKYENDPFLTWKSAPGAIKILDKVKIISKEIISVMRGGFDLPSFSYIDPTYNFPQTNNKWKVFMLQIHGKFINSNVQLMPSTFESIALANTWNAFISVFEPGCVVPLHIGPCKTFLTYVLAIQVPKDSENCYLIIKKHNNNYRYLWDKKKGILYDDNYPNTIVNATTERLVVLYVNFKRNMSQMDELINEICLKFVSGSQQVLEACQKSIIRR